MANKTIQFLRNKTLYGSHDLAVNGIKAQLASAPDGSAVIARYNTTVVVEGVETKVERTLFGIAGKTAGQYEIFDNQGGNDAIKAAIEALDVPAITAGDGEFIKSVSETDGKINATYAAMPTVAAISETGRPIVSVSQSKGTVAASAGNINAQYVNVADTGGKLAAENVEAALAELADKITANAVTSDDGTVVVTPDAQGGTNLEVNIDNSTLVKTDSGVGTAKGKISTNLHVYKLTNEEISALGDSDKANIKDAYQLQVIGNSKGTAIGEVIKIYKDSALYRVYLGHTDDAIAGPTDPAVTPGRGSEALCFIYQKADGTYELVAVNVESFLQESEFEDGLEVDNTNHTVSVKIDDNSERFLTVGSDGVKLSGVQDAINTAINTTVEGLDATVSQAAGADGLALSITETNGKITAISGSIAAEIYDAYGAAADAKSEVIGTSTDTKTADTINGAKAYADANKADVIGESTDASSASTIYGAKKYANEAVATAVNALNVSDTAADNQFVTAVSETNGKIYVTRARPTADSVSFSNSHFDVETTNVADALVELAEFDCGTY